MHVRRRTFCLAWAFSAALPLGVAAQDADGPSGPPFALPRTFEYVIDSKVTGWTYRVVVAVPLGYELTDQDTTRYPVLYMLDGGLYLGRAATSFRGLTAEGPGSIILVGIGRPGGPSPVGWDGPPGQGSNRMYDYTPTANDPPFGGGADDFLEVMRQEVFPLVEREFRTSSDRGLWGASIGGLFVAYTLLAQPDMFTRYGIASPSLWWDNEYIYTLEEQIASARPPLAKRVHVSVGSLEGSYEIVLTWRLVNRLCVGSLSDYYAGLDLTAEVLDGEIHESPLHLIRSLDALYPSPWSRTRSSPC